MTVAIRITRKDLIVRLSTLFELPLSLLTVLALAGCLSPPPRTGKVADEPSTARPSGPKGPDAVPYQWRNVTILGGGFVTGVVFSPIERDLIYARTDIGGAYRYVPNGSSTIPGSSTTPRRRRRQTHSWVPLTDMFGRDDANFWGIESIALDPTDASTIYMAAGTYTQPWAGDPAMLSSNDRGVTWKIHKTSFRMGGNEDGRSNGERLAVDPNSPNILFFGSRKNGLMRSADRAKSWSSVSSFPAIEPNDYGIVAVLFDKSSGKPGSPTPIIYAAAANTQGSLYVTKDAGSTWSAISNQPQGLMASHVELDTKGTLYVSLGNKPGPNDVTTGAVYTYEPSTGAFTEITPLKPSKADTFGYGAVSVDRQHPGTLVVTTIDRWTKGHDIFRTTDGGKSWKPIGSTAKYDENTAQYLYWGRPESLKTPHWMGDIDIDPFNPARAIFVTGAGLWMSENLTAADKGEAVTWKFVDNGLEETSVGILVSPPNGAPLLSGVGDICGFRHDDLDKAPPTGFYQNPSCNGTTGLDYAASNPDLFVRVGRVWDKVKHGAFSTDGGRRWSPFLSEPSDGPETGGLVAVTADGKSWVWSMKGAPVCFTKDRSRSWTTVKGAPFASKVADWANFNIQPAADREDSSLVYLYDVSRGAIYVSNDAGESFTKSFSKLPEIPEYQLLLGSIHPVPGRRGNVWLTTGKGLYVSTDGGKDFDTIDSVQESYGLGFGKPAPGRTFPTVYLAGKVEGKKGYFRSEDGGDTWLRINDDQHQYGSCNIIEGDPRVYGRVYLGTPGRGIMVGEPAASAR